MSRASERRASHLLHVGNRREEGRDELAESNRDNEGNLHSVNEEEAQLMVQAIGDLKEDREDGTKRGSKIK